MTDRENSKDAISLIDLRAIKFKLIDEVDGKGWSLDKANGVELLYRRFLYLNAVYPNQTIVPTKDVDEFWHAHILDTRKYAKDCDIIFGYFFHHFPYFGIRSNEDRKNMETAFDQSIALYEMEFPNSDVLYNGEDLLDDMSDQSSVEAAVCGGGDCSACGSYIKRDPSSGNERPGSDLPSVSIWH